MLGLTSARRTSRLSTRLGTRLGTRVGIATVALLFAAGAALVAAPQAEASIALPSVVGSNPADWTPNINDGAVYKLLQAGSTMFAGGEFTSVTSKTNKVTYSRSNLVSFVATTGALKALSVTFDAPVWALATDGRSLYAGGEFTTVNGAARRGIVKINPTTGAVDPAFNARIGGNVTQAQVVNGRLIVSGTFPKKIEALNLATGADTGYINLVIDGSLSDSAGRTQVFRFAVNPAGNQLVGIGNFTTVAGQNRKRAFMLSLGSTSSALAPWYYQPLDNNCYMGPVGIADQLRDVDYGPTGRYFVIVATGGPASILGGMGRDICDSAALFDAATPNPSRPTWINYTGGDTLHSVAATTTAIYVQGHQRWQDNYWGQNVAGPGAVERQGIAAIDPVSGKALSWNPGKDRGVGGKDMLLTPAGLWVGSDTTHAGGEPHYRLAFFPK